MLDSQRIYVGFISIAVGDRISINVSPWQKCSFQAVPRYGADLTSWDAGLKRNIAGTEAEFSSPLGFTSSAMNVMDVDTTGVDTVVIVNDAAGVSGFVDFYMVGKSVT